MRLLHTRFEMANRKPILVDAFERIFPARSSRCSQAWLQRSSRAMGRNQLFDPYFEAQANNSHPSAETIRVKTSEPLGAMESWTSISSSSLRSQHRQGKRDNAHELFACIMFDVWWRKYIKKSQPLVHWQTSQELAVRILNVAQTYYPYLAEGGRPAKVRILSRKLAERGHKVTVLTANLGSCRMVYESLIAPKKLAMGLRSTEDGVVAIYLPTLARYRALTINPRVIRFCRVPLARI